MKSNGRMFNIYVSVFTHKILAKLDLLLIAFFFFFGTGHEEVEYRALPSGPGNALSKETKPITDPVVISRYNFVVQVCLQATKT